MSEPGTPAQAPARRRISPALVIVPLLVAGLVFWWGWNRSKPHIFSGAIIQSDSPAPDFTLMSAGGPVSLSDFKGKVVAIYFGYTFCPDVCPATMAELAGALDVLGGKADDVQVLMISVDPARDTPEVLADYVAHFDDRMVGLSGTEADIASVATLYGVYFQKEEGSEATGYLMDHTATVMVIDQDGYLKLVLPFGVEGKAIASDISYLLK